MSKLTEIETIGFDAGMRELAQGKAILYFAVGDSIKTYLIDRGTKLVLTAVGPVEEEPWRIAGMEPRTWQPTLNPNPVPTPGTL